MSTLAVKETATPVTKPNIERDTEELQKKYHLTRQYSEQLAAPLSEADVQIQSMPDASPTKWHLAHTTWFFETFILSVYVQNYQRVCEAYNYLFNSYYNGIGEQYPRSKRGLISRPSLVEVMDYRKQVDESMLKLLSQNSSENIKTLTTIGIHHEQQHQELLLTDIQHGLSQNPLFPAYSSSSHFSFDQIKTQFNHFLSIDGGVYQIGHDNDEFAFDNEKPRHSVFLEPYSIADQPVTNGEYLQFMADGVYQSPEHWLSDGWAWVQSEKRQAPLYWYKKNNEWWQFTLSGLQKVQVDEPVTHISYYEAAAYAHWAQARLPTEAEWEVAAEKGLLKSVGNVWEWTSSGYSAYPGFTPFAGNAGEYNGKFMNNQYVLRGGSCVTPSGHSRITYRNFFYAHQSWQYTGIRLASL